MPPNPPPELPGAKLSADECAHYGVPFGAVWGRVVATEGLSTHRGVGDVTPPEHPIAAAEEVVKAERVEDAVQDGLPPERGIAAPFRRTEEVKAEEEMTKALQIVVTRGRGQGLRRLIGQRADVSAMDVRGWTALHHAAVSTSWNNDTMVKMLLQEGADPDVQTKHTGKTPLHLAARGGFNRTVMMLLDKAADPDVKTKRTRETPLHLAAKGGHKSIVRMLLNASADLSVQTKDLETPLHLAVVSSSYKVVEMLLNKGADVHAKTSSGQTPHGIASAHGKENVARMLRAVARRTKCQAFAMGQHERLGALSMVLGLEPGVVRIILDQV